MSRLMNLNEPIPDEFFIFVDQFNPITHHNFNLIGTFTSGAFGSLATLPEFAEKYINGSASYLPFEPCDG